MTYKPNIRLKSVLCVFYEATLQERLNMNFSKILMASAMLASMMLASCGNGEGEQSNPAGA